jgi:sec-independent protein translocase protein TatB
MFDVGWSELVVIAVVALIVIGPKELPSTLRAIGKMTARARKVAGDFRAQFDEALREADLDDVRQTISDAQKLNPMNSLRDAMNPLRQMGNDIKADLQRATKVEPAADQLSTPAVAVSEPSLGLPETPPVVPPMPEAVQTPLVAPVPSMTPSAEQLPTPVAAKARTVRTPRAKVTAKADETAAAAVTTPVVAEKPKRAPRKTTVAAKAKPADKAPAAPRKRAAPRATASKKDEA